MERICTGCAVQLREDQEGSFCSAECQRNFELTEAYCNAVWRAIDGDGPYPLDVV